MYRIAFAAVLAGTLATSAAADRIRIDFTGTGTGGAQTSNNVFGTPVPTASGYLIYDSDTPASSTTGPTATNYRNGIMAFVVDFGSGIGVSFDDGRSTGSIQVRDAAQDSLSFNNVNLGGSLISGADALPAGTYYSFTLGFREAPTDYASQELLILEDPASYGRANLSFNVLRPSGSPPTGTVFFNYIIDLDNVTVTNLDAPSEVPAPPALALAGIGLAGVAAMRRRRG